MRKLLYTLVRRVYGGLLILPGAKASDIVIVENASSGINAVLRSLMPYFMPSTKV